MLWSHTSKTVLIGKQGISCNQGIPAIVFCSRNRVPVAEAIQDRALGSAERRVGDFWHTFGMARFVEQLGRGPSVAQSMRFSICALGFLAVWVGWGLRAQDVPIPKDGTVLTFHVYMNLIQIPTLVLWPTREPINKPIDAGKFSISIDSGPWFPATHVRQEGEDPISLSILLDLSGDTAKLMPKIGDALASLAPLSLRARDRVSIYGLSCGSIMSIHEVPAASERLKKSVELALEPWMQRKKDKHAVKCEEGVGLWDGLALVSVRMTDSPGRRVILVVTDGNEKGSKHTWSEVTEFAQDAGIAVFGLSYSVDAAIGDMTLPSRRAGGTYRQMGLGSPDVSQFISLCEMSGGIVTRMDERRWSLQETLQRFVQMVRQRYIVEFPRPSNSTAGKHDLQVKVGKDEYLIQPSGVSVPIPDPALMSDPTTVPSHTPEQGPRKPVPKPQ